MGTVVSSKIQSVFRRNIHEREKYRTGQHRDPAIWPWPACQYLDAPIVTYNLR